MSFLTWLSGSTPGGAVGEAGAKVIEGLGQTIEGLIEEWHLPPAQAQQFLLAFKQAELQYAQAYLNDVEGARQMQAATHSYVPGALTLLNVIGFFGVMIYGAYHGLPATNEFMIMVGALVNGYGMVLSFWLGSSRSSQSKDWMLWRSTPSGNGNGK